MCVWFQSKVHTESGGGIWTQDVLGYSAIHWATVLQEPRKKISIVLYKKNNSTRGAWWHLQSLWWNKWDSTNKKITWVKINCRTGSPKSGASPIFQPEVLSTEKSSWMFSSKNTKYLSCLRLFQIFDCCAEDWKGAWGRKFRNGGTEMVEEWGREKKIPRSKRKGLLQWDFLIFFHKGRREHR